MKENNIIKEKNITKNQQNIQEVIEIGGQKGLEPTRYGVDTPEWEKNGRVSDF